MEKKCTQWPPKITLNTYLVEFSEKFAIFSYFSVSCDPLDGGSVYRGFSQLQYVFGATQQHQ